MKTERRHELQTNELASVLTQWIERVQPHFKTILGVLVLIVTVAFAVAFVNGRNTRGRADAWTAYFNAFSTGDASKFDEVSEAYPETDVAMWALLTSADANLTRGTSDLFRDRDAAYEELEKARDAYRKAADQATVPMIKHRALFGLGQALESLGEFQDAEKQYEAIIEAAGDSAVGQMAQRRLEIVRRPDSKEWYDWFAKQEPAKTPLDTPGLFDNLPNLPDTPNIDLPQPGELLKPGGDDTGSSTNSFDFDSEIENSNDSLDLPGSLHESRDSSSPTLIDPLDDLDSDEDEETNPDP